MRKPSVLVSPITCENDFQLGQAVAAEQAAARLGIGISITFAENDAINQSQQLLNAIHNKTERPEAGVAIQLLHDALGSGSQPPEWTVNSSESLPEIQALGGKGQLARGHHA